MGNCVQSSISGSDGGGGCRHSGAGGGGELGGRLVGQRQTTQSRRRRSEEAAMMMDSHHRQEPAPRPPPPSSVVVKVKMVLTKDELAWLVARLNEQRQAGDVDDDRRRLEDVLREMAARGKVRGGRQERRGGWRPGLECIVECPRAETAAGSDGC